MRVFLSILSLLIPFSINAYTPNLTCPGEITLEAEWIYFAPTSETSYYAIVSPLGSSIIGTERRANLFDDFHSGYRLSAAYTFCHCDRFLSLTWTRLRARHSDEIFISPPGLIFPVLGFPDLAGGGFTQASDNKTFSYNALDVIAGQPFSSYGSTDVIGFAGIHYAHLFTKENYAFALTGFDLSGNLRNSFWGVGPELGITIAERLGCGFSLQGSAIGAMLIGKQNSSFFFQTSDGDVVDVTNQPAWQVVPYSNIRIGLQYLFDSLFEKCSFQCFTGTIEIGYEVPVYFNALSNLVFVDDVQEEASIDYRRNVTMHGPYLSLALRF